ncbi:MAG: hypothetical protein AB7K24_33150 [Gemmataceae bacterium]
MESERPLTRRQANAYDLIIFHYLFLTNHWGGVAHFRDTMRRCRVLKDATTPKIMLPQDEFYHADLFCEFIREFSIQCVFSVAPESEWEKIYREVDFGRVKFFRVLTGYIDEEKLKRVQQFAREQPVRPIDIGYRTAGRPYFWFGRHGYLKQHIADLFEKIAPSRGLSLDISTSNQAIILGDDWYRFLLRCKYTLGVESGTSLLDWDGSVHQKTQAYVAANPSATFDDVEAACFPGRDGEISLFALSPRHLEACMTRTCQVLTEGHYNGVLQPDVHYIQMRKDLADAQRVIELMSRDELRQEMVERAYQDLIGSGAYSYRRFVEFVIEQALRSTQRTVAAARPSVFSEAVIRFCEKADQIWQKLRKRGRAG